MPAESHGWLTAGTESLLKYQGCCCCLCHKSQALTRASTPQQAKEAWILSVNHSFTTSLANSSHCQRKWFLAPVGYCLHTRSVYSRPVGWIYFLTSHLCGMAHVIIAALLSAVYTGSWNCLTQIFLSYSPVDCWIHPVHQTKLETTS